jgi:hypothetical protein
LSPPNAPWVTPINSDARPAEQGLSIFRAPASRRFIQIRKGHKKL